VTYNVFGGTLNLALYVYLSGLVLNEGSPGA